MIAKFQYTTLAHQTQAVQSIAEVFADVRFVAPTNAQSNPVMVPREAAATLRNNIFEIRKRNGVTAGSMLVHDTTTPALAIDVLMETGTGKTFTFIETIHRLHNDKKLAKFIVLVPSNAIRQGTLKSLQTTAEFFSKQFDGQKINVYNYSAKTVHGFINAANAGISVLVATYQSFAGDSKVINKRGVEANLFGQAKSYMEALAHVRPVLIIDEPHRFEGKQTQEYLAKFNPLMTIRFGATFKNDEYKNLIYTLDSLEAFRQRLVKGIAVDTVGTGADMAQLLCLNDTGTVKARIAQVSYQTIDGKNASVELQAKDNLGEKTGIAFLDGHVVESITGKELLFTNGFALPLGEATSYGMLAEQVQALIIERSIANHFEREEELFKRGIKALSLFFIDSVAKYMPEGTKPAAIRTAFERHYRAQLALTLEKPELDPAYRLYLERSATDIGRVHKGYFARSHSEKGEEEAIKLILQEKEKLLSFDTDLRFIFSMWALQEGWDNPNIFTLCKLAPSNSKITKLQQIGRGLRLAVNQQLERVQSDDPAFDEVNQLVVVVPASEGNFVEAIQSEIAAHSVQGVSKVFDQSALQANNICSNPFVTVALLTALSQAGLLTVDTRTGLSTIVLNEGEYNAQRDAIYKLAQNISGVNAAALQAYLDAYFSGFGKVKNKADLVKPTIRVNPENYQKFKDLWQNLNRDSVLHYELDSAVLTERILQAIRTDFNVRPLSISITRTDSVESLHQAKSTQKSYDIMSQSVYTLAEFVRELANLTKLSYHVIGSMLSQMPADKFEQIRHNESRALTTLRDLIQGCIYELLVNKVSYELREVRAKTSLTDIKGQLLASIPVSLCGVESHDIRNSEIQARSLYLDAFMPVDSKIERDTVDDSSDAQITVFAKLPKINIPTPAGNYNPDFGYVLARDGKAQALYLVVETKGYDNEGDIPTKERWKIDSAKRFFKALQDLPALKASGVRVKYETKINGESLAQLITSMK
jgi:type III restriction enzyme